MEDKLREQIALIDRIMRFNTNLTITGQLPTSDQVSEIKEVCRNFKGYHFNTDVSDIELFKQIAEFADSYKKYRKQAAYVLELITYVKTVRIEVYQLRLFRRRHHLIFYFADCFYPALQRT